MSFIRTFVGKSTLANVSGHDEFDKIHVELVDPQMIRIVLYLNGAVVPSMDVTLHSDDGNELRAPGGAVFFLLDNELNLHEGRSDHIMFRITKEGMMHCASE